MVTMGMNRLFVIAAVAAAGVSIAGAALADSPRGLVSKGNRQYHKKSFGEALEYYDKASVEAPESPIVAFNKGAALYRQGDYEKAREQFKEAASRTKSLPFEAKAWYNLGNVEFKEGERQEDSDLQKALGSLQESVKNYVTALEKAPELTEAAENLEIARLKIKDLLDKIKNQQQQQGGEQNQQQNEQGQQQQQDGRQEEQGEEQQQEGEERQQQEQQAGDENAQQKKDQQAAADKEQQKPLESDKTARQILDEEKENRKERQRQEGQSRYRPVGKDW